jgi:hypothetical protein
MKKLATVFAAILMSVSAFANRDSIIVQFGGSSKMVIQTKDKSGMTKIKNYDLNKILRDMVAELDSNTKETYIIIGEKNGAKYKRDTVLVFKSDSAETKTKDDVSVSFKDGKIIVTDKDGRRRTVTLGGGKGGQGGKGGREDGKPGEDGKSGQDDEDDDNDNDDTITIRKAPRAPKSPRKGFNINWGMNVYGQNNAAGYNKDDYDLRSGSMRYISLGWVRSAAISKSQYTTASLDFGLDFSWYNLMFDGNNTVKEGANNKVQFPELMIDNKVANLAKSKLTAPFVNVSLMPTLAFRNSPLNYISAGMYAGYRIGGYTKTKMNGGDKDKIKGNFGMNDFRYGIGAEVGFKNFPDLFINYDLTELFQTGRGPAVRMISFGVRL